MRSPGVTRFVFCLVVIFVVTVVQCRKASGFANRTLLRSQGNGRALRLERAGDYTRAVSIDLPLQHPLHGVTVDKADNVWIANHKTLVELTRDSGYREIRPSKGFLGMVFAL